MSRDIMRIYSFSEYPHSKIPRANARGILVMTAKIRQIIYITLYNFTYVANYGQEWRMLIYITFYNFLYIFF